MIIEVEMTDSRQRLSQGDIIQFMTPEYQTEEFGVIVTGDCDIAQKNVREVLSFCYVMKISEYVENYIIPVKNGELAAELELKVRPAVNKAIKKEIADHEGISVEAFQKWIPVKEDDFWQGISSKIAEESMIQLRLLRNFRKGVLSPFQAYKELGASLGKSDLEKKLRTAICNKVNQAPGDKFYFSYIPHIDDIGFVVNLRRIGEIRMNSIATAPAEEATKVSRRLGRLKSPFREKLAEKLGSMFSDIALPKEYETERETVANQYFDVEWRKS